MSRVGCTVPTRSRGAALLLVFAILGLAATFVLAGRLVTAAAQARYSRAEDDSLMQAKEVLIGYAATYWDTHPKEVFGYLPCPALNGDGATALSCGSTGESAVGHLPFRLLEIAALRDSTGNCLWYVVSGAVKYNPKPNELNWDSTGQFIVKDRAGNVLSKPSDADGGALALVIAPGAPLDTQARTSSETFCGTSPDYAQFIDSAVTLPSAATQSLTMGTVGDAGVNDRITWITTKDIFDRIAGRSQFTQRMNDLIGAIVECLKVTHKAPAAPVYESGSGKLGRVPSSDAACTMVTIDPETNDEITVTIPLSDINFRMWQNWRNQFRYALCGAPGCVVTTDDMAASCQGVLLFGGARAIDQSHSTAADQANPRYPLYLDDANAVNWASGALSFDGASQYDSKNPGKDIAICIR